MPRNKWFLAAAAGALVLAVAAYFALANRSQPSAAAQSLEGLAWIPADAGLVVGIDLAELRQQQWLLDTLRGASGEVTEASDYRAFIAATGFDYARDLDRLWVGLSGPSQQSLVTAVAQGRFDRAKILAYARAQSAAVRKYQGVDVYSVQTQAQTPAQAAKVFAFAFLDDTHMAFASDAERAARIIDCWQGRAPAVGADAVRRAEFERLAAGRQVWLVDDTSKWAPPYLSQTSSEGRSFTDVVTQLAVGAHVSGEGVEVAGEARCREERQAERLRDTLFVLLQLGRLAVSKQQDENARALARTLDDLSLSQQGASVEARVALTPQTLAALLRPPAAGAPGQ